MDRPDQGAANAPPAVRDVALSPVQPVAGDEVRCSYVFEDEDGDEDRSRIAWSVNDAPAHEARDSLPASAYSPGDRLTCTVTPYDGEQEGVPVSASAVAYDLVHMLKDIHVGPGGADIEQMITGGGRAYFIATDSQGRALWTSDGTLTGTQPLRRLSPEEFTSNLVFTGGALYFVLRDDAGLLGLWTSDGTPAGTTAVAPDIFGFGQALPIFSATLRAGPRGDLVITFQGEILDDVWVSDGSAAGTITLAQWTARHGALAAHTPIVALGGMSYFVEGGVLYETDLTPAGTAPVGLRDADGQFMYGRARGLVERGGKLYFVGSRYGGARAEPWVSDGTDMGTLKLATIQKDAPLPSAQSREPEDFFLYDGRVYFTAGAVSGNVQDVELWVTDGTPAGTKRFADLRPGPYGSEPTSFHGVGNRLVFAADIEHVKRRLWSTDGTTAGTAVLVDKNIERAECEGLEYISLPDRTLFATYTRAREDASVVTEVWSTDGTIVGTTQLAVDKHIDPLSVFPVRWRVFRDELYMAAQYFDSARSATLTASWRYDATLDRFVLSTPNEALWMDYQDRPSRCNSLRPLFDLGARALFVRDDGAHGEELWVIEPAR